jgi:hypothetical protein
MCFQARLPLAPRGTHTTRLTFDLEHNETVCGSDVRVASEVQTAPTYSRLY